MSKQERKSIVPELRFQQEDGSDYPDWKITKLKSLATRQTARNRNETITRVLTNSAAEGVIDQRDYFDKDIAVKGNLAGYSVVDKGDYVYNPRVSTIAPVGPISRNNLGKGVMSPLYTVFRFNDQQDRFYEQYFKSTHWHSYMRTVSNVGARHDRMSLSNDDFMSMPLPVPNINEREKVTDCLSSIDDLITSQTKKLEALKAHKKGLMQQLFPAEGETVPKLRFPEFLDAGMWEILSIEELIQNNILFAPKDGNHGNIHPKTSDYVSHGIPFIMANNIKSGEINLSDCSHISKIQADNLQKGFAKEEDVLFTHKGTVGEVAIVGEIEYPYLMLTPQVTYYRVKNKEKLLNRFLAYSFISERFKSALTQVSGGGTRAYIGITAQRKLNIAIPPSINEQHKISDFLNTIDYVIKGNEKYLTTLKNHKKGLIQRLFPSVNGED